MRIHMKLIVQTCVLFLIATTLFFFYIRLEFKKAAVLFQSQRSGIETTFDRIAKLKSKTLETVAVDYTYWDEMVGYARRPDKEWAEENLRTAVSTYGADLLAVYAKDSRPVSHFSSKGNDSLYEALENNLDQGFFSKEGRVTHFFIYTPAGLFEVYAASIHPTADPERKSDPQGYLFVGKVWNREYIDEISRITGCNLQIVYPYGKATLVNKNKYREEVIQFSRVLRGWNDLPVARVDVTRVSQSVIEFKEMSRQELILVIVFALFIVLVYIRFILKWVHDPLALISRALKENNLKYIVGMQSGNNEFAEIARLIFKFSENKIQLAREIELLKAAEDQLEKERDRVQEYLDIAGVMIMILDQEGIISMINKKGCAILGYEESELLGKNWFELCLPEENRREISGVFNDLVAENPSAREYYENYVLRRDGKLRMLAFHNAVLKNKSMKTVGILVSGEDITKRKEAEKELRRVSEELRVIIDSSQSMIMRKDRDNRFVLVNKAFTEKIGLPREQIEGRSAFDLFPAYAQRYWKDDLEVIETNTKKLNILEYMETDKGLIWLHTDKVPYIDDNGNIIGVISFSLDITEYKQAVEKLRESEERYRVVFNSSYDALMTLDPQSLRFTSGNAAAIKLFGLKDENEFINLCPCDISPEFQPDGMSSDEKARKMWEIAVRDGGCYFEWVHKRRDGTEFPCLVLLSVFSCGDKKIIHASVRDITERKKIEDELNRKTELLEAQKEASPDGLLVVDENGQKALVNRRLIELWEVPKEIEEDKNDESLLRFVTGKVKNPEKFLEKVNYLYSNKEEKSRDEVEFKNGMFLERYSSPVIDKNGKYFGRIWTFRDITELKQAEQELKKDLHDLEVFYKASIGREERILELKKQIKELESRLKK
ncbi:MAG: PAS domain S-box protein [Candidatus Omnitrophota bacterium]